MQLKPSFYVAEDFSYEELDESRNERPSLKRKSLTSVSSEVANSGKKKRTSNASTASTKSNASQKAKTVTATKHRYPTVDYEPSEQLLLESKSSTDHHTLLSSLLEEVLAEERKSLTEFAQSTQAKTIHGKKYIFESLNDVLASLAEDVNQNFLPEASFEPELSKAERAELKPLLETKRQLEAHSHKLDAYIADIDRFVADNDLWLGESVVKEKLDGIPKV